MPTPESRAWTPAPPKPTPEYAASCAMMTLKSSRAGHAEILNNEAWHEGGPLGVIVAADTLQIAEEAVQLIDVEWEQLPFYLDPEAAIADGADILYEEQFPENNQYSTYLSQFVPDKYSRKDPDLETGFAEADEIIEEKLSYTKRCTTPAQSRAAMSSNGMATCLTYGLTHRHPAPERPDGSGVTDCLSPECWAFLPHR